MNTLSESVSPAARSLSETTAGGDAARRLRDLRVGLLLGLLCLLVYNANLRTIGTGDSLPARYQPFALWRYGTLRLDPIRDATREGHPGAYWIVDGRSGHPVSLYPVVLPVLVAPLYLPAVAYLQVRGWTPTRLMRTAIVMEKLTASLLAAAATTLFYLLLRRRAPPGDALLLAAAFAFGTETWVIGSQALWQHGLAELMLVGALLLLTGECTAWRALAAGILCGLIAGNRPPDALLAAALGLYGLRWAGRRWGPWLIMGAVVPAALVLTYNLTVVGNLVGGYAVPDRGDFFREGLLAGIAGLLVSPGRGLLVFSPFLLLVPAGFRLGLRDQGTRALTLALGVATLAMLLLYAKADWRGGRSWGPRWLTDVLPLLMWMLPPALAALRRGGRSAFALAVGIAIALQAVGAFWYTGASDAAIMAKVAGRDEMAGVWSFHNAPYLAELRHGPAPRDPAFTDRNGLFGALGSIDRVTVAGRPVATVAAHSLLTVEGWALIDGRSPTVVEVALDGQVRAVTTTLFDRPDVRLARQVTNPAGWRLDLPVGTVAPGPHVLTASARMRGDGRVFQVGRSSLTVGAAPVPPPAPTDRVEPGEPADLRVAAGDAAATLRAHQQLAGFWLTSYTSTPTFADSHYEMNTYLTAMMVDLLSPIATSWGFEETLTRARAHLDGQIETSGLVRYHGRPHGPTIPALGCPITPDADDTALAWRIAGLAKGSRGLLPGALATLEDYRTPDGLYRTWLAPRDRFQCLDPGKDPDPADAGIQMHVFLLLAQVEPAAGRALCGALGHAIGDDRLWVYYQIAPIVPLLRAADVRQAGCDLAVPAARLRTPVSGQEIWVDVARLLASPPVAGGAANAIPAAEKTTALLRSLAKDDFAALRQNPPLLYHNDLTAHTPRYYWSEDFGYALWLRLYADTARRRGAGHAA